MKVGVFGDSFANADQQGQGAWFDHLPTYCPTISSVRCHGLTASDINFSAYHILEFHKQFDFVIWCVTSPFRVTTPVTFAPDRKIWCLVNPNGAHVNCSSGKYWKLTDKEETQYNHLALVGQSFVNDFQWETFAILQARALVEYVTTRCKNVMLIPCFDQPLKKHKKNLFNISQAEFRKPRKFFKRVMNKDPRICHLNAENNQRLARYIVDHMHPGVLDLDIDHFDKA